MKTQVIFWPKGGSVEKVANQLGELLSVGVESVESLDYSNLASSDLLIFGGSTIGADHWRNDSYKDPWTMFIAELKANDISLQGKKVALFGLGNQILYPAHFVDSIKTMADILVEAGAELVGACENVGYEFTASEALVDGKFIGLPLDEDTQADKTEARLKQWIADLGL